MKTRNFKVMLGSEVRSAVRNPEIELSFEVVEAHEVNEGSPSARTSTKRSLRCCHGNIRSLCVKCAGLPANQIAFWDELRTKEKFIHRRGVGLYSYTAVKIFGNDCVLTSRTHEMPVAFQDCQFSRKIGAGAAGTGYAGSKPPHRQPQSDEEITARGLFLDPNSRVQAGGVGYLRQPLDAPRETRAHAPEWFERRTHFFATLRPRRAARAERIFSEFYLGDRTDRQIADGLRWKKDSVKKERADLLKRGSHFFESAAAKHPP
jgi:hypothetical protein